MSPSVIIPQLSCLASFTAGGCGAGARLRPHLPRLLCASLGAVDTEQHRRVDAAAHVTDGGAGLAVQ